MLTLHKIICPIDFSEPSSEALSVAGTLARQFGAELYVVHILDSMYPSFDIAPFSESALDVSQHVMVDDAEQGLRDFIERHQLGNLQPHSLVRCGLPAREILNVAEQVSADIIVIAAHGTAGWRRYLFGSVTDDVLYSAPCPVLVVKGSPPSEEEKEQERAYSSIR